MVLQLLVKGRPSAMPLAAFSYLLHSLPGSQWVGGKCLQAPVELVLQQLHQVLSSPDLPTLSSFSQLLCHSVTTPSERGSWGKQRNPMGWSGNRFNMMMTNPLLLTLTPSTQSCLHSMWQVPAVHSHQRTLSQTASSTAPGRAGGSRWAEEQSDR